MVAVVSSSRADVTSGRFYAALFAEFLGTLLLVLVACGAAQMTGATLATISLAFGLTITALVWSLGGVSGGALNPAVAMGLLVARRVSAVRGMLYIVAETLGALVGAAILKALLPAALQGTLGTATPHADITTGQAFGVELLITFVLVLTVFSCVDGRRGDVAQGAAPVTIGLAVAACHLFAVPLTGAGMNPARVLGPAVVSGTWRIHWVYWVAPLIGGAVAALLYDFLFATNATPQKARGYFTRHYDDADYNPTGNIIQVAPSDTENHNETNGGIGGTKGGKTSDQINRFNNNQNSMGLVNLE